MKMFPEYGCQETYDGERITALVPVNDKLYIFTATKTYVFKEYRWYQKTWMRVVSAFRTVARQVVKALEKR